MKKTVFVLGLVLALVLGVSLASAAPEKGSWTGFISDAKCGAKGAKAEHAGCAEKCIKGGSKAVLVTEDGTVYEVANQDQVTAHAGHQVKVDGTVDKATKTVTVTKVTMTGSAAKKS